MSAESPTRPARLPEVPPVEVAAAMVPSAIERHRAHRTRLQRGRRRRLLALGDQLGGIAERYAGRARRASARRPRRTSAVAAVEDPAGEGDRMADAADQATAPLRSRSPSMMEASHLHGLRRW